MIRLDLSRADCPFAAMRAAVEAGAADAPVTIYHDGKPCLTVASLYRGACLTTQEEPSVRFVAYTPHPRATIGPRVSALLVDDRNRRALLLEASKKPVRGGGR